MSMLKGTASKYPNFLIQKMAKIVIMSKNSFIHYSAMDLKNLIGKYNGLF